MSSNVEQTFETNSNQCNTNNYTPISDDFAVPTGPKENERFATGTAQQSQESGKETSAMSINQSPLPLFGSSFDSPEVAAAGALFGPAAGTAVGGLFNCPAALSEPVDNIRLACDRTEDSVDTRLWSINGVGNINASLDVSRRPSGTDALCSYYH